MIKVLFIGRPTREKGLFVLMRALMFLGRNSFSLTIVGDPPPELTVWRQRLHADTICCLGSVPNRHLPSIIRRHDVLIVPSLYENFGNVALEAMACGVPVVASNTGGLSELVRFGRGILFPTGNYRVLAAKLRILQQKKRQRIQMGIVASIRVRRYGWLQIGAKVAQLLTEIASKHPPKCENRRHTGHS